MGVTAEGVRAALGHPAGAAGAGTPAGPGAQAGPGAADGGTRPPFAPEAATALRDALAEALELGHNYIGTEHLLLGLMRDPDAPVTALLGQLGASPAEARVRITELLRGFSKGTGSSTT
jgi:hypothetical protein